MITTTETPERINYRTPVVRFQMVRESTYNKRPLIHGSEDAKKFCLGYFDEMGFDREVFVVVTLDTKHRPISIQNCTTGTLDSSLVHPREVFKLAIADSAAAIIIAHNHPSGDPTPSRADHAVTDRIKQVGEILGISVLDHIVCGDYAHSIMEGR